MRGGAWIVAVALLLCAAAPADAVVGFRAILPVGQGENVNAAELAEYELTGTPPATFVNQLAPFENLLYDAPSLTLDKLLADFPASTMGTGPAPLTTETPRPGVTITRDALNVPHIKGTTRSDSLWGTGYAQAEDRLFEMDVLRHLGRAEATSFVGPSFMDSDRAIYLQSDYTEAELQQMIDNLPQRYGALGERTKQDATDYAAGITAFIQKTRTDPSLLPSEYAALHTTPDDWTVADCIAVAAMINQGFDLGGGSEVTDALLLAELRARLGAKAGARAYADIRRREDPTAPTTTSQRFPFDNPGAVRAKSVAAPDPGSVKPRDPFVSAQNTSGARAAEPAWAKALADSRLTRTGGMSYAFLVGAKRSASGHPVADMGPQVNFYSPELFSEVDIVGPDVNVRGAVLPGALPSPIVGHTDHFAYSVTIGVGDHIDTYAEELCEPDGSKPTRDSMHYLYKGKCLPFLVRDRQESSTPNASDPSAPGSYTLRTVRSVHGPIQSTATVHGAPVAYARADATYMHLGDTGVFYDALLDGTVTTPQQFIDRVAKVPFSLNWFYIDRQHIAWTLSGFYPRRAKGVAADKPAWGTGQWDWKGFNPDTFDSQRMPIARLPHVVDPKQGYIANWNNKPAPGWRAADDTIYYGSVHRVQMVRGRINTALKGGPLDPVGLAALVEDADTVDLRGERNLPLALKIIGKAPDAATQKLVDALAGWVSRGAHRRDLDKDNVYEDSAGVALMDAWYPKLVPAMFRPALGKKAYNLGLSLSAIDDYPAVDTEAYYNGWYGQVGRDLSQVLGYRGKGRFSRRYCGGTSKRSGTRKACRALLLKTLKEAGAEVAKAQGSDDPAAWKVPATCPQADGPDPCDQLFFTATGGVETPPIPWQNRPTFQQVVELDR